MIDYISQEEDQALITDFNILLDRIVQKHFLLRFNQPYNALEDIEKIMMEYAELVMIPNELTDVRQLEQYNILSSKINIIPTLGYQYCEKVFQKPQKQDSFINKR